MSSRLRTAVPASLAALMTVLLIASGITAGASPASAAPGPSVTVSVASVDGGEVTVTGSGFAAEYPGIYVGVGAAGATGFYQAGTTDTVWVALTNEDGVTETGRTSKLNADGTFSLTLTVAAPTADVAEYAVYTSKAHGTGMSDRSQDTVTPVTFAEPEPEPIPAPSLAVSKTSLINPDGETITVTGTNIKTGFVNQHGAPTEAGVYVQIGYLDSVWRPSADAPSTARANAYSKWVKEIATSDRYIAWTDNGDGTADFSWDVEIDHDTLQEVRRPGATLAVFTLGAGGTVQEMNELVVPISFNVPAISVSKTANLDSTGETITVTGSGFLPNPPQTSGSRAPLNGIFSGAYVAFGKFPDVWQPSEGAPSSARKLGDNKWLVHASELALIGGPARGGAVVAADGTFSIQVEVKKGYTGEPETGNYGIYSYAGGGAVYDRFETYTPISFTPLATDLTFTASPSGQAIEGEPVTLKAALASPTPGSVTFSTGGSALGVAVVDADGVATLAVKTLAVGTHALTAQFTPADPGSFVGSTASLSYTVVAKPVTAAGSFTWGVKQSFRDYVTGPIATGSISTTNARSTGNAFVFGQAGGGTFNGSTGTSNYTGSVRFLGHGGILNLTLGNPVVRIDSASSGTLLVQVNGSTVPFATLALGSGSKSESGGAVSYSRVPATLTGQGAAAFVNGESQFYPAGTALDPVSFVIGAPSSAGTGTRTVSEFVTPNTVPPTPPATTGINLTSGDPGSVNEGDEVTITADGFESNEQGIKVVIYSDPVILATDVAADSAGVVTWTGVLPSGLTGEHTLTLQGSVDRGIVLTIANRIMMTTRMNGCVVNDATITWGFKEAFRSYISGAIARGEWTVADGASYETPSFGWSEGEGSYDAASGEGLVTFAGSVNFTGHGGVLNTTISNPQLRFDDADTATLLLDVSGDTRDGVAVDQPAVEFATIDLGGAEIDSADGTYEAAAAPAVLTAAGSAAFGTYEPATELDPITITFSTDAECAAPGAEGGSDEAPAEESAAGPGWLLWVIIAAALAVIAAIVWTVLARRRSVA